MAIPRLLACLSRGAGPASLTYQPQQLVAHSSRCLTTVSSACEGVQSHAHQLLLLVALTLVA
jgi:hypothetical protein